MGRLRDAVSARSLLQLEEVAPLPGRWRTPGVPAVQAASLAVVVIAPVPAQGAVAAASAAAAVLMEATRGLPISPKFHPRKPKTGFLGTRYCQRLKIEKQEIPRINADARRSGKLKEKIFNAETGRRGEQRKNYCRYILVFLFFRSPDKANHCDHPLLTMFSNAQDFGCCLPL